MTCGSPGATAPSNDEAAAAGFASAPDPDVDTSADWMWWQGFHLAGTGVEQDESQILRVIIDNRSMRRMNGNNKRLVFMVTNAGGTSIKMGYYLRTLLKLH